MSIHATAIRILQVIVNLRTLEQMHRFTNTFYLTTNTFNMEDPNLLDTALSTYNGEIVLTLAVPIESVKGTPEDIEGVAIRMKEHLMEQLSQRGVHLPLVLEDWEIEETKYEPDVNIFDKADDSYESNRDDHSS